MAMGRLGTVEGDCDEGRLLVLKQLSEHLCETKGCISGTAGGTAQTADGVESAKNVGGPVDEIENPFPAFFSHGPQDPFRCGRYRAPEPGRWESASRVLGLGPAPFRGSRASRRSREDRRGAPQCVSSPLHPFPGW